VFHKALNLLFISKYHKYFNLLQVFLKYCLLAVDLHLVLKSSIRMSESLQNKCKLTWRLQTWTPAVWELYHCVHPFSLYSIHILVSLFLLILLQTNLLSVDSNLNYCIRNLSSFNDKDDLKFLVVHCDLKGNYAPLCIISSLSDNKTSKIPLPVAMC